MDTKGVVTDDPPLFFVFNRTTDKEEGFRPPLFFCRGYGSWYASAALAASST